MNTWALVRHRVGLALAQVCWEVSGLVLAGLLAPGRAGARDAGRAGRPDQAYQVYQAYHWLRRGRQPFAAVTGGRRQVLASLRGIPAFCTRDRVSLASTAASTMTGVPVLMRRRTVEEPLLDHFAVRLDDLRAAVAAGIGTAGPAGTADQPGPALARVDWIRWSRNERRRRAYVVFQDAAGGDRTFVKLRRRTEDGQFQREAAALLRLDGGFLGQPTPRLRGLGTVGDCEFIATSAVPAPVAGNRTLPAPVRAAVVSAIQRAHHHPGAEIREQWWWRRWVTDQPAARVAQASELLEPGCLLGPVHGNLSPANVLSTTDALWIVDWECSDLAGPSWVDLVTTEIYLEGPVLRDPGASAALRRQGAPLADIVASAIFMAANGHALARDVLTRHWLA